MTALAIRTLMVWADLLFFSFSQLAGTESEDRPGYPLDMPLVRHGTNQATPIVGYLSMKGCIGNGLPCPG